MEERRIILVLIVSLSMAVFAVQSLSQTRRVNRTTRVPRSVSERNVTLDERGKRPDKPIDEGKGGIKRLDFDKRVEYVRLALGVTEEQWNLIKPKLEKVYRLREQSDIWAKTVAFGTSTSNTAGSVKSGTQRRLNVQWMKSWEGKANGELTEGERIAEDLIKLIEDKNANPQEVKMKIDALRKYEQRAQRELPKAQQELRTGLTVRQEAALVLTRHL